VKPKHLFLALTLLVVRAPAAVYEWTAAGDGVSFFQEANWTLAGGGGTIPLIDPNVALLHDLVVSAGQAGGPNGFAAHLRMGGRTLTLGGGVTRGAVTGAAGIHNDGTAGGSRSPLVFTGGELLVSFLSDIAGSLSGNATLTLYGGGNPLDNATLALDPAWSGQIRFQAETPANVRAEHLAKITLGGQPVVENTPVTLTPVGSTGCTLTRALPAAPTLPAPPVLADSDGDGLPDAAETGTGTFVSADNTGSSPSQPNSDGDRFRDGGEVLLGTDPNRADSQPALPNIVLILTDDLGWNHLGAYRRRSNQLYGTNYDLSLAPTPYLDGLAAQGMLFTSAYAGCTVCGPSRSSLQTGVHSGHVPFKVNSAYTEITPRLPTLGELFRRHGYVNGYFGKWGLAGRGSGHTPNDRGYHRFVGMHDHGHGHFHYPSYLIHDGAKVATGNTARGGGRTSLVAAERVHHAHDLFSAATTDFIGQHAGQAFFCTFATTLPHTELIATDAAVAPSLAKNWPEYNVGDNGSHYPQTKPRAHFAGMLKMIDDSVGAILQQLETHGLADNTIVIFTSDNGGQLQSVWGSAPSEWFDANGILRGGKQESYEGGLRVPMIVRWPGKTPAGGTSDHPLYFADFMPTFCELLGTPPPSYTDGISFLPTLENRPQDQRAHAFLYWCHQWSSLDHAVRSGKWKAVKRGNNPLELYDLESDLRETTNVAAANPAVAAEMQQVITREFTPDLNEPKPSAGSPVYPNDP
jgi:arylsulfatase A-like enzyme